MPISYTHVNIICYFKFISEYNVNSTLLEVIDFVAIRSIHNTSLLFGYDISYRIICVVDQYEKRREPVF